MNRIALIGTFAVFAIIVLVAGAKALKTATDAGPRDLAAEIAAAQK
jgi:hypothetical protein